MTFDESVMYKDRKQKVLEITNQVGVEVESFDEALQVEDSIKWEQAIYDEMRSLEKNDAWVLTDLPAGKRALLNKWVFRIKIEPDGKRRFKARLVVKGYSQRKGIDYAKYFLLL